MNFPFITQELQSQLSLRYKRWTHLSVFSSCIRCIYILHTDITWLFFNNKPSPLRYIIPLKPYTGHWNWSPGLWWFNLYPVFVVSNSNCLCWSCHWESKNTKKYTDWTVNVLLVSQIIISSNSEIKRSSHHIKHFQSPSMDTLLFNSLRTGPPSISLQSHTLSHCPARTSDYKHSNTFPGVWWGV